MSGGLTNISLLEHHFKHWFESRVSSVGFPIHSQEGMPSAGIKDWEPKGTSNNSLLRQLLFALWKGLPKTS